MVEWKNCSIVLFETNVKALILQGFLFHLIWVDSIIYLGYSAEQLSQLHVSLCLESVLKAAKSCFCGYIYIYMFYLVFWSRFTVALSTILSLSPSHISLRKRFLCQDLSSWSSADELDTSGSLSPVSGRSTPSRRRSVMYTPPRTRCSMRCLVFGDPPERIE